MNPVVESLERTLLTPFNELAESLKARFLGLKAYVRSDSYGHPAGDYHHLYISCLLADVPPDRPDLVDFGVSVTHLLSSPKINADVCWGECGLIEAEFSREPVGVSEEILRDLYADLPRLYAALTEAVERGQPSSWGEPHA